MEYANWRIIFWPILLIFIILVWKEILFNGSSRNPEIYFFDVGQGDSEMIYLNNKVKILIDAGPNNKISKEFSANFSRFDKYIDFIILSHPQVDHFGGILDLISRYQIGAFIYNGIDNSTQSFQSLKKILQEKKIPTIVLNEKDKIRYLNNKIEILWPPKNLPDKADVNEDAIAVRFVSKDGIVALFTGDIGAKTENLLAEKYNMKADILKVAHHGSKYSSGENFLREASPKISVIEVGKNSYGHPTEEVLGRLMNIGSQIFRTDQSGTIKISLNAQKLNIFAER